MNKFILTFILLMPILTYQIRVLSNNRDLTAKEMVRISEDIMQGDSNFMHIKMDVLTLSWQRQYEMFSWMKGRNKTLIRLISPSKKKGEVYLKRNLQLWMYMPNVERKILIPPSSMLQPFLGGNFSYDDLVKMSRLSEDYDCRLIGEDIIRNEKVYVIELIPKPEAPVVYDTIRLWLHFDDFIPLRQEFYDEHKHLLKTLDFFEIKSFGGHLIPSLWEMTDNIEKGRKTVIKVLDAKFNLPLEDEIFSYQRLR